MSEKQIKLIQEENDKIEEWLITKGMLYTFYLFIIVIILLFVFIPLKKVVLISYELSDIVQEHKDKELQKQQEFVNRENEQNKMINSLSEEISKLNKEEISELNKRGKSSGLEPNEDNLSCFDCNCMCEIKEVKP